MDDWRARWSLRASRRDTGLLILASHAVLTDEAQCDAGLLLPQQRLTLADLRAAINALKALDYRFVSPVDIEHGLPCGKHCLLTFDDGYRNNLEAVPLLQGLGVPALFFVVPSAVEDGRSFWWDAVFRKARLCGRSEREMNRIFAELKRLPPTQIGEVLRDAGMREQDFMPVGEVDRPMNRQELQALARLPGMFVGNHTFNHEILTHCGHAEGTASLVNAQRYLETIGGNVVPWVAYPNGNFDERVMRMAEEAGLRWGVTLDPSVPSAPLSNDRVERLQLGRLLLWGGRDMARQVARMDLEFSLERAAARIRRRRAAPVESPSPSSPSSLMRTLGARWLTPRAYFVYVDAAKYSGQRRATELVIAALSERGYEIVRFGTPALDRDSGSWLKVAVLLWRLGRVWLRAWRALRQKPGVLHVNLAQSEAGLMRDGTFLLLRGFSPTRWPAIISLHGNWFMNWPRESIKARWLAMLARRAFRITVLGADQRDKLLEFGMSAEQIDIVDNTCELTPLPSADVVEKHAREAPIEVLFLAILVDTKGYPEFLDALVLYSELRIGPRLQVTLCGAATTAGHSARFTSVEAANRFIQSRMDELQERGWVDIRWVKQVEGDAKAALFRSAAIFVLPTKLDAQPLVLLEAMASGCAVLTTNVGQIAQSVGPDAAIIMEGVSPRTIATELACLAGDPSRRLAMGQAGQKRFAARFTRPIHDAKWVDLVSRAGAARVSMASPKAMRIWFAYADAKGFSGQKAATLLVIAGMRARGAECLAIPQPVRPRDSGSSWNEYAGYVVTLLATWVRSYLLIFRRGDWLHVSIGQTRMSLLRDGIPVLFGRFGLGRSHVVISLNGNLFMSWDPSSVNARLFGAILRQAGTVTVLGRRQLDRLSEFGVPRKSLHIVPNSCDQAPLIQAELELKLAEHSQKPLRVLHLSSLIASKGYPQYLEALKLLARQKCAKIEAVLCGRVIGSEFDGRFANALEAEAWINATIDAVNESDQVSVRWVRGAMGEAKTALFLDADIFVMPTHYAVEAQPLVLLEAMALGCAIITTNVGEIGEILDQDRALILPESEPRLIADAIMRLMNDGALRRQLARAAHARFVNEFHLPRHLSLWGEIFSCPGVSGESKLHP